MTDNIFSANHRNAMIEKYGYTQAQTVSVEELEQERKVREYENQVMEVLANALRK